MDDRLTRRALARRRHDLGYVLSVWPIGCAFAALLAYCLDIGGQAFVAALGGAGYAVIAIIRAGTGRKENPTGRFIVKKSTAVNIWTATVSLVVGVTAGIAIEAAMDAMARPAVVHTLRDDASPKDGFLADSALLCVNARQYLVTGVSTADHRMVPLKRQGRAVSCTGGVTLADGGTVIAVATPAPDQAGPATAGASNPGGKVSAR